MDDDTVAVLAALFALGSLLVAVALLGVPHPSGAALLRELSR